MNVKRLNCWEYMKCGREPGGKNAKKCGICPATQSNNFDSFNKGQHAGRFCWAVAGTFCGDGIAGTYAEKLLDCLKCPFLKKVNHEENRDFTLNPD